MMKATQKSPTAEKWRSVISDYEASGVQHVSEWCRQNEISYDSFIFWRRRLRTIAEPTTSSFIELADKPSTISGIEIHRRDLRVVLQRDFDPATLIQLLHALEKL